MNGQSPDILTHFADGRNIPGCAPEARRLVATAIPLSMVFGIPTAFVSKPIARQAAYFFPSCIPEQSDLAVGAFDTRVYFSRFLICFGKMKAELNTCCISRLLHPV